jgi:hypothetical protein
MSELDLGTLRLLRETAMRIDESSLSGGSAEYYHRAHCYRTIRYCRVLNSISRSQKALSGLHH